MRVPLYLCLKLPHFLQVIHLHWVHWKIQHKNHYKYT